MEFQQVMKWQGWMNGAMESCPLKMVMSGGAGEWRSSAIRCESCNVVVYAATVLLISGLAK